MTVALENEPDYVSRYSDITCQESLSIVLDSADIPTPVCLFGPHNATLCYFHEVSFIFNARCKRTIPLSARLVEDLRSYYFLALLKLRS